MWLFIFSILYWLFLVVSSIFMFSGALILWLLTSAFDKKLRLQHWYSCVWGSIYFWLNPYWTVRVEGREKIDSSKIYVAVSNHQSILDIIAIHYLFFHFKWVSKKENLYVPFIGWNMLLNRYVILDRASRKSFIKMMRDCRRHIDNGSSIMIFPEGTRSEDGQMRSFKDGAFRLALQANCPVLPIVLDGTGDAVPKKGFILRKRTTITIRVLDPVTPEKFSGMNSRELTNKVRDIMESELNDQRQRRLP
jgi:1-acyl-sn-glycerol-3-phosphate acyltransferase